MKWNFGLAKAVGQSHLTSDTPCQDSVEARVLSEDAYVIALSDGAGSAVKSHFGSQALVESICSLVGDDLERATAFTAEAIDQSVKNAILAARNKLRPLGIPEDFHATAVIAVGNNDFARIYHIGDGSATIAELSKNGDLLIHRSNPENGEFSNETFFYTQDSWEQHLRIKEIKNPLFIILASDGVDPFIWDNKGIRMGFVKPLISKLQSFEEMEIMSKELNDIINDPRTNHVTNDDKSIIVLMNKSLAKKSLDKVKFLDVDPPIYKSAENLENELKLAFQGGTTQKHSSIDAEKTIDCVTQPIQKNTFLKMLIPLAAFFLLINIFLFGYFYISLSSINQLKDLLGQNFDKSEIAKRIAIEKSEQDGKSTDSIGQPHQTTEGKKDLREDEPNKIGDGNLNQADKPKNIIIDKDVLSKADTKNKNKELNSDSKIQTNTPNSPTIKNVEK